jgi:hypothetical protein
MASSGLLKTSSLRAIDMGFLSGMETSTIPVARKTFGKLIAYKKPMLKIVMPTAKEARKRIDGMDRVIFTRGKRAVGGGN